jgi:hypothetical protein
MKRWEYKMPKNETAAQNDALIALLTSLGDQIDEALEEMGLGPDDEADDSDSDDD